MALNIKNPEVDRLARRVAELRETGVTEAVRAALERDVAILQQEREARVRRRIAETVKIQQEVKRIPVRDPRPVEEIVDELWDDVLDRHR